MLNAECLTTYNYQLSVIDMLNDWYAPIRMHSCCNDNQVICIFIATQWCWMCGQIPYTFNGSEYISSAHSSAQLQFNVPKIWVLYTYSTTSILSLLLWRRANYTPSSGKCL